MAASIPELLRELREMVLLHPAVRRVQIRGQATFETKGYLRLRLVLRSQDLVEVFVYLVEEDEGIFLKNYS